MSTQPISGGIPGLNVNSNPLNGLGLSGATAASNVKAMTPQPKEATVKTVAPTPTQAEALATATQGTAQVAAAAVPVAAAVVAPVAQVQVELNGQTRNIDVNAPATGTTSTATSSVKGASAEDVKAFNAALAEVDAKVGKSASGATERAKNVAEARSKLSGKKLAEFDTFMKATAEKTGANFGRNQLRTDVSKLSASQQAVLSEYTKQYNGAKEAPATTAKTEPTPEKKAAMPAPIATKPDKFIKLSDSTQLALHNALGQGDAATKDKLLETNSNTPKTMVSKADLTKLGLDGEALEDLSARALGNKQTATADEVVRNLHIIEDQSNAARREG